MNQTSKLLLSIFVASLLGLSAFGGEASAQDALAKVTMTSSVGSQVMVGEQYPVTWDAENFPSGAFININLIKKVSDVPVQYNLVRQIAQYTPNDGTEVWTVSKGDIGSNLYLEVTCAGSTRFKEGCVSSLNGEQFEVKAVPGNSIANALLAFLRFLGLI